MVVYLCVLCGRISEKRQGCPVCRAWLLETHEFGSIHYTAWKILKRKIKRVVIHAMKRLG